ncbi:MAG: lipid-binding SYLF domain-containing protein [Aphanocapsa sp. GSE-SYN-MK-11-07L]|jgi:lipid-binding SYLF domain-containing protein|nr:lipid-binding SYLF domain-containing protein [Aphanocapsa sp. GSE-SYN-MK-11-07L]
MNLRPFVVVPVVATMLVSTVQPTFASQARATETVQAATQIFSNEVSGIPRSVLQNALGIAIIPRVVKAGFILGGTRGSGVLAVRNPKTGWSDPAFVALTGGSVGFQFGAQSSDVIIVFNTRNAVDRALARDFSIGGNVSATAGPSGATPVTNSSTIPDVYTYVRNREGLFAGVSLQGTKLGIENNRNADFYQKPNITAQQIFDNPPPAPAAAAGLRKVLSKYAQ